jgi:hypothetical protein
LNGGERTLSLNEDGSLKISKDLLLSNCSVRRPDLLICAGVTTSLPVSFALGKTICQRQTGSGTIPGSHLEARVRELERLLGKVTLENEFLKKAVRNSLKQAEKKQSSLPKTSPSSKVLKGGAN